MADATPDGMADQVAEALYELALPRWLMSRARDPYPLPLLGKSEVLGSAEGASSFRRGRERFSASIRAVPE